MAKKPQIPLKEIMAAIDKKDRNFYNNLSDEGKKAFSAVSYTHLTLPTKRIV